MPDPRQLTYRLPGLGSTRLILGPRSLRAGQPRNGYRERDIPLDAIDGFCIEPVRPAALAAFTGDFVLAFRDGDRRRVYRLAVDLDDLNFRELVEALGQRCPAADHTGLPVAEALARMQVPSSARETL